MTPEQKKRVQEIRERLNRFGYYGENGRFKGDIRFLLSLLDAGESGQGEAREVMTTERASTTGSVSATGASTQQGEGAGRRVIHRDATDRVRCHIETAEPQPIEPRCPECGSTRITIHFGAALESDPKVYSARCREEGCGWWTLDAQFFRSAPAPFDVERAAREIDDYFGKVGLLVDRLTRRKVIKAILARYAQGREGQS